jgi:NAD(P)-dependent dehydrogenase (short-subunit alcohol dehydrogenase family)
MIMNFENKQVLITGGSRGIGAATAKAFSTLGARVCINFRHNRAAADELLEQLPGSDHFAVKADIASPDAVRQLIEAVIAEFSRLDIVINNAGVYLTHPLQSTDYESWQQIWKQTLDLNLTGVANVCYWAARQMIRQGSGGHIVNVSSRGAFRGEPFHTAYGASKAGLNALTQSLAQELGQHQIFVNAVAPGFVATEMTHELLEGPLGEAINNQSPLGRVARAEEVANAILYLASAGASFSTGAILDLNGASYLRS